MAVGFPTKVSYANGDVFSSSDINDTNGTINLLTSSTLSRAGGKNAIINGGFDIWQRGTSSTAVGYGTADRWYQNNAGGTGTFAQETTTVPTGARYAMKFTASSSAAPQIHQYIETMQVIPMQGQTVTLSASVGASTSTAMGIDLAYTTSVDSGSGASWTTITPSTTTSGASVTTYQRLYSIYSIPSTATSLRVRLFSVSNIANTVVVYFGNVQLELGSVATTFSRAGGTIQGELANCQRYYQRLDASTAAAQMAIGSGWAFSTSGADMVYKLTQEMRVTPTVLDYSNLSHFQWQGTSTSSTPTAIAYDSNITSKYNAGVTFTKTAGYISGGFYVFLTNSSSGYIGFGAEL